jgi:hypothetical protein
MLDVPCWTFLVGRFLLDVPYWTFLVQHRTNLPCFEGGQGDDKQRVLYKTLKIRRLTFRFTCSSPRPPSKGEVRSFHREVCNFILRRSAAKHNNQSSTNVSAVPPLKGARGMTSSVCCIKH